LQSTFAAVIYSERHVHQTEVSPDEQVTQVGVAHDNVSDWQPLHGNIPAHTAANPARRIVSYLML